MGLMGTLAKVAIGYAAARGVDRFSGGQGAGKLLGGGAQVKGKNPASHTQAQIADQMSDGTLPQGSNPMDAMMAKMKEHGIDLSRFTGGTGGAAGANPLAGMMQQMMGGGAGATSTGGDRGGLLSSAGSGGGAMGGLMGALGGAAAMQGKGMGALLDQFNTKDTAPEAEKTAGLMLRAMIQAAKADGGIDESEKAKILATVGDDASAEDMAFVQAELKKPVDAKALAAETPEALRAQVYSASLMTIRVDTQEEAEYLNELASAMGLEEPMVNMIHMQMGLKPLYK